MSYDELRAHLHDVHQNEAAHVLSDDEVSAQHWEEHNLPGGLRSHAEPIYLHTWQHGCTQPKFFTVEVLVGDASEIVSAAVGNDVEWETRRQPEFGDSEKIMDTLPSTEEAERPGDYDEEHLRALRPGSQPLHTPNDREGAHDALLQHLREGIADRMMLGLTRYHSLLQAGNGRDSLRDALEEVLDLAAYLQVWIQARNEALELLAETRAGLAQAGSLALSREAIEKIYRVEHLLAGGKR